MDERLIFHVDVNSAFLSWESVRRVSLGQSDLRTIPAAVGGDRGKRTSVILAKSIPAKKYGVTTGEPVSMAFQKCPNLVLVPPDFQIYRRFSAAFMDVCRKYAPVVQKASIDECFLDMSGTGLLYPDPIKLAYQIKDEIRDTYGFTVNVGIGSNKLLAKMASDFEKPDKVHTLFLSEIREKMWPLPIENLMFVGKMSSEALKKQRIMTIGQLATAKPEYIQGILGDKGGIQAWEYANGIDDSIVTEEEEEAKGYSMSTTLEEDVTSYEQANRILLSLSESVARRMRADGKKAFCIGVTIRLSKIANINGNTPSSRFTNKSHQKKLERATDVTNEIYQVAVELYKELWHGEPLRLLKVALSDLTSEAYEQMNFLVDERHEKERKVDAVMDKLKDRFGSDIVRRASDVNTDYKA